MWWIIKALRALGDTWPLGLVLGSLDIWAQDWHVGGGRGGGVVVAIGACFLADYLQRRAEERAVEARAEEHLERVRTVLREVKQRARELDPTALDDPDVQCDVARVSALAREFIQRYPSLFAESNAALDRIIAEARAAATSRKESRQ